MSKLEFNVEIRCGKSKKKTERLFMSFGNIKEDEGSWTYDVFCEGIRDVAETGNGGFSALDCCVLGTAYLRQTLREIIESDPKMKLYFEVEGVLDQTTLEEIFWVHDCAVS